MPDVVICEFMDEAAIAEDLAGFDVLYDANLVDRPADLAAAASEARALIVRNRTQVRGPLLEAARNLEIIGRLGVGLDNIDVSACEGRSIAVVPAKGANDTSVAEYVITSALMLLRGAYFATDAVVAGSWPREKSIGREIAGTTLGLVGFGAIARETAWRAQALGMRVMAHDPHVAADNPAWNPPAGPIRRAELRDLLAEADVVSLHVPLTPETRNLIDDAALATMKTDAILINAARGGVVDETALGKALRAGTLGGAALDVFASEPIDVATGALFADCPNLVLTPHIAGVTIESNARVSSMIASAVAAHLRRRR